MRPPRDLSVQEIAALVKGELLGPADLRVTGVAPLDRAGPSDLTFLASGRYLLYFQRTNAGAVLLTPEFRTVSAGPATRIVVPEAHDAVRTVLVAMYPPEPVPWGVNPTARIEAGARWDGRIALGPHAVLGRNSRLGADCIIGHGVVIGADTTLGDGCRIGSHASVGPGSALGSGVVLQTGARVGTEGFAYTSAGGEHLSVPHVGQCSIGNDVEIGANTTIDRGSIDDTVIGHGTKIDNLVHIGHNVRVGARCLVMAQVGMAGSTVVEDEAILAGQAGLAGHLTIGRAARVAAQSGVIGDIPPGETVSGYPARRHRDVLRQSAALRRLAPLVSDLERLIE